MSKMSELDAEMRGQLSLFDQLSSMIGECGGKLSPKEILAATESLSSLYQDALERETSERLRREEETRCESERKRKERHNAHVAEVTCMDLPLSWDNAFCADERARGIHTESIPDALIISQTTLGRVDIEYISAITGESCKTVINTLKGAIYQNPDTWGECFYKGWETSDEYLSGNMMRKLRAARKASEVYNGYFDDNVAAIERLLPPAVSAKDIFVTLGSPWVPIDVINDFIDHLLGLYMNKQSSSSEGLSVIHDEVTGTWEIPSKSRYSHSTKAYHTYGTRSMGALDIIERTLNMKALKITREVKAPLRKSGKNNIIDRDETLLVLERQKTIIAEFGKWIWADDARKERLESIFEEKYSCIRRRQFDGSFLTFPTMSKDVLLYSYQKNAVARILFSPNTLLAHDVGSGKTYIMVAAGMELRRMGISQKNLYVVPNSLIGQWRDMFLQLYPNAKLLCVEPKEFTPEKRESLLETIRDDDFDGVIMAYSCFELIPLSKAYYTKQLNEQKSAIAELAGTRSKATSRLKKRMKSLDKALADLNAAIDGLYDRVYFDELGVNTLLVDEAHNFKNVPIQGGPGSVLGINSRGSRRCQDMMDKVHCVQRQNGGRGVVMATGTPITNSITDAYVMQRYLQSGELELAELQSFTSWIGMFAERRTGFEIDVDTSGYRLATRFSRFHNLPELTALLASVADFHRMDSADGLPALDGYDDALIGKTDEFQQYLDDISQRADAVRSGLVCRSEDNMLKITSDGRKAALDMRLVEPKAAFTWQSKVARCAENVYKLWNNTSQQRLSQLIFCDTSTPKNRFNIYDELSRLLTSMGVPPEEIAFVHDAATEKQRGALFSRVRRGEVRVLLGSTFKLGLGVNVQDRLVAVHHLDVPWRPADVGRGLRAPTR